jgi:hypothetical protein
VDYFGNPLGGAVVTVGTGILGTQVIQQGTADENGWASFLIYSESMNATGVFPLGPVTLVSKFGGVIGYQNANIGLVNKDVTVSLALPGWTKYIIPIIVLVAIVALIVVGYFLNRIMGTRRARRGL